MGENAQKIGKKLESVGFELLSMFNWKKKMGDKEIKCTRSTHKNSKGASKRTHGVDLYMEYKDPYLGGVQGVFIECKNRGWASISKSEIQNWVNEEINLIDCARNNSELQEFYADGADKNCALIIINCNDGKYDHKKFEQYLSELEIPNKKIPYKIFIAGNKTLEKWDAIDCMIKTDYLNGINVLYPSINNSQPISENYWSLNHLFAKYILALLEIFSSNWSYEAVIQYLKTGFIEIEDETIYEFENYARKLGIKGKKWYKEDWKIFGDEEKIEYMNRVRKEKLLPLVDLKEKLSESKTVDSMNIALYQFLIENNIEKQLKEKQEFFEQKGNLELAKEQELAWNIVVSIFEEMNDLFKNKIRRL